MSVYDTLNISEILAANTYPGRGIIVGTTPDGTKAVSAYFIMGRSQNSRNRVFKLKEGGTVITAAFDESKVEDPSLIIYNAIRAHGEKLIVTNGDQTDTVYDGLENGLSFGEALKSREFEPDGPNFTPRISAVLNFENGFDYQMSILKSADAEGSACARYLFDYPAIKGVGHFIHTYNCDGNPIPTFTGEPERIAICDDINCFADAVWNSLNEANKISLYVRYTSISDGKYEEKLINKNV